MDTTTFINSAVAEWADSNLVFVKVNGDGDSTTRFSFTDFAKSYGIRGYPTLILLKPDGEEIDRVFGTLDTTEFVTTFSDYIKGKNTLQDLLTRVEAEPSAEMFFKIGGKLSDRRRDEEAKVYLQKAYAADSTNAQGIAVQSLMSLGMMARGSKNYDEAVGYFQSIVDKYPGVPDIPDAELSIAGCFRRKGDTATAIALFEKWLTKYPNNESAPDIIDMVSRLKGASLDSTKK